MKHSIDNFQNGRKKKSESKQRWEKDDKKSYLQLLRCKICDGMGMEESCKALCGEEEMKTDEEIIDELDSKTRDNWVWRRRDIIEALKIQREEFAKLIDEANILPSGYKELKKKLKEMGK